MPQPAPYAAITAGRVGRRAALALASGDVRLDLRWDGAGFVLVVTDADGHITHHRSRRSGRPQAPVTGLGLTLTGTHVTGFAEEAGHWQARARFDAAAFRAFLPSQ